MLTFNLVLIFGRIEKLYLCAGRDGYVPLFEPNADQPQYGCLESSQRLKYRLLLLVGLMGERYLIIHLFNQLALSNLTYTCVLNKILG